MLSIYDIIYFIIYLVCLVLSFRAGKSSIPGLLYLRFILCFGLLTELIVVLLNGIGKDSNPPYYIYIPVEYYCLVRLYALQTTSRTLQLYMYASVPLYLVAVVILSFYKEQFFSYPSLVYCISCLLNSIWISLLLFNFDFGATRRIWQNPLFIIFSAFLIFFAGIFFFNTAYSLLLKRNQELAKKLRDNTNVVLNMILYLMLSYGFICSDKTRK